MIAEANGRDALAEAKQKALDQALAGPTGRELAALQHEITVLKKRLEESDLNLATVEAELAQAQAEHDGRECRYQQWLLTLESATEAGQRPKTLKADLEAPRNVSEKLRRLVANHQGGTTTKEIGAMRKEIEVLRWRRSDASGEETKQQNEEQQKEERRRYQQHEAEK